MTAACRDPDSKKRMNAVRAHFNGEASGFDAAVTKTIPHYREMLEALVSAVPFPRTQGIDVIDLGSGTGNLSLMIRKRFPNANITCLDISERMLEICRSKLGEGKASYVLKDLSEYSFDAKYDAVVSSLALHHLEVGGRQQLFAKVYGALRDGGAFLNADIFLASSAPWQELYLRKWRDFLSRSLSAGEISEINERYRREDRPVVLLEDLRRLGESGFKNPDILWKYYNFAVYGATK